MTLYAISVILFSLLGFEAILIAAILINKVRLRRQEVTVKRAETYLIDRYFRNFDVSAHFPNMILVQTFVRLSEQIQLSDEQKERALQDFESLGLIKKFLRELDSPWILRRKRAINYLSYFMTTTTRIALGQRLRKEKVGHVKIFLINALKIDMDQLTVLSFIESVVGSRRFYQSRVIEIVKAYLLSSHSHFPDIYNRPEVEIKELFVDLAGSVYREDFREPLFNELAVIETHLSGTPNPVYARMKPLRVLRLYHHTLEVLSNVYGYDLEQDKYLLHADPEVARIAFQYLTRIKTFEQIVKTLGYADGTERDDFRVRTIARIVETNKAFYDRLIDLAFEDRPDPQIMVLAKVLVLRVEYLMLKMQAGDRDRFARIIALIIASGSTADFIGFLNKNKDPELEKDTLPLLAPLAKANPVFLAELNEYLDAPILKKMGFAKKKVSASEKPRSGPEKNKTRWLIRILIVAFSLLPLSFLVAAFRQFGNTPFLDILKAYVILLNRLFITYYLVVNAVYILLALLSAYGSRKQSILWGIKNKSMLFEKGMLASISIIAPAYNEEMSIVESVHSLLNLNYPDFEVVVVNDGSKDGTLEKLISHFKLERKNVAYAELLRTRPVRAIYKNKYFPNLTVVDKENGGKADALNVGVNASKNDYICGIDADSILESESLLRLMSSMLDHDEITLALGGNIFPVNGCTVDHGQVENKGLPKRLLARLQAIEYLRAFSLSRVGWSLLDSLLIVSGAFGLFEKQILIECGGYLTQSTKDKDTVGEDMELVVRITRQAYDTNLKFRVDYIPNAICYTEVPEETKSLLKQRNRWQRGLIDILSYHRKMILNRHYKQAGFIGLPYFFLFEMVGPLLEIQGYAAIFLGLVFGILNLEIVLLLAIVTIVMGIGLSLSALLVAERDAVVLDFKDTVRLLLIAIFENFGWRQFIGIYRVKGFFSSLRETNAWGTVKRVGFHK